MNTRRYSKFLAGLVTSLILFSPAISPALAAAGDTTRVTVASNGMQSNNESRGLSTTTFLNSSLLMFTENISQFGSPANSPMPAALAQASEVSAGNNVWTNIGPEGGYINALAIDPATPTTLYAGTWFGGAFKSTNGGTNWSAVNTGLTATWVLSLAIDPATPATLYAGTWGGGVFVISFSGSGVEPTVTTLPASDATLTSATLNGTVNPNGSGTNAWFEWGTDSNLATLSTTSEQAIGAGTTAVAVSEAISNLKPGVPYYYRVAARNSAGTARGDIQRLIILMGNPPSGSHYPQYWNKYDRLIYEWADQYSLYAPLVKALFILESQGLGVTYDKPELAFLYEPVTVDERYVTKAILGGTLPPALSGYTLSDNPPPSNPYNRFWNEFVPIPSGTTSQQMKSKNYLSGRTYGLTNPYGTPSSAFVAQYRIASSYGLGQVVYWWHYTLVNGAPETLYDPEQGIKTSVRVLNVKRNNCAPSATKTTSDFAPWEPVLRAYNGGGCNSLVDKYVNSVKTWFSSCCQPVLAAADFDPGGILSPHTVVMREPAKLLPVPQQTSAGLLNPDEYEVDRLVADFKGVGQQQLAILYFVSPTPPDAETIVHVSGGLKVFTDGTGQTLEWQSPLVLGTAGVGRVFTTTVPDGGSPLIAVEWASGAHGFQLHLYRWNGSTFEEVLPIGSDSSQLPGLFGDAGVQITSDGQMTVSSRDANQPLTLFNVATYTWTGQTYEWSQEETISNATYRQFLPLICR